MSTAPLEETLTVPLDGKKSQQEDVLAQVKVLLEEIRAILFWNLDEGSTVLGLWQKGTL